MIEVRMQWQGEAALQGVRRQAWQLVLAAATLTRNRAVVLCSKPAQRIRKRRVRTTSRGKRGSQYTVYIGSKPGQPPQVRTSLGRRSIHLVPSQAELTARVGVLTNAAYMGWLETGTRRVARRPWLSAALREAAPAIQRLIRR